MNRLVPAETLVLVVDIQERLAPAMPAARLADVIRSADILLEAAALLGMPVAATEQYPKGLGPTLAPIAARLDALSVPRVEKLDFSAADVPAVVERLDAARPRAVVVIGMEAHVCVFQTARALAARGLEVHVAADGVASRRDDHRDLGLSLAARAGALVTTTETVAFDLLARAGGDAFKALSKLIR